MRSSVSPESLARSVNWPLGYWVRTVDEPAFQRSMFMIRATLGQWTGLWALSVFIPAIMVPLMIYHAGLDAWQEPLAFIYLHLVLLFLFRALLLPILLLNRDSRGALAWATGVALILYT